MTVRALLDPRTVRVSVISQLLLTKGSRHYTNQSRACGLRSSITEPDAGNQRGTEQPGFAGRGRKTKASLRPSHIQV
jgi:hypothetical protein